MARNNSSSCRSAVFPIDNLVACEMGLPTTQTSRKGMTMTRRFLGLPALILALQLTAHGDEKAGKLPPAPTNAAFETMKKLAGTWMVADDDGKPTDQVASIIKVTAGGSVVHETLFPGQPHEMVSVYSLDGPTS